MPMWLWRASGVDRPVSMHRNKYDQDVSYECVTLSVLLLERLSVPQNHLSHIDGFHFDSEMEILRCDRLVLKRGR